MLLRPRQKTFVERSVAALGARGNTLGVAPTGAGKTIMLSAVTGEMIESGAGASGEAFSAAYLDLIKRYQGPAFAVDDWVKYEWAYIPHFLGYSYYVYQYATSIAAGTWFARSILDGGKAERERYLDVLRAGGSAYPVELLKHAGLDMTSPEPYRALVKGFGETIDAIEALIA